MTRTELFCASALPLCVALLSGCGDGGLANAAKANAARETTAATPTPIAAAAQTRPAGWAGEYRASFDGADGSVTIKGPNKAGYQYELSMEMAGGGCSGEAQGGGAVKGKTLTAILPVGNAADGWKECKITLTRGADGLTIREGDNCAELHGMSCGFTGTATKAGEIASTSNASPSAWLVGSWVAQGAYCASGDPIQFATGGGYRNASGDIAGRWTLRGSSVAITYTEIDPTSGAAGARQQANVSIKRLGADDMLFGQDRMKRCPAGGGAEPWHPGQTFSVR